MISRRLVLTGFLCLLLCGKGNAQLAQSFYNITAIETKTLPNGIQITVRTDGTVNMGIDITDFIKFAPRYRDSKVLSMNSFRLRFVGARSQISANTDIGLYPVDSARLTLADGEFTGSPFFYQSGDSPAPVDPTAPKVDIYFSFYVPVRVPQFSFVFGDDYGWDFTGQTGLQPRDVGITVSSDRRSVILKIISDRVEDVRAQARAKRSLAADWKHRLTVAGSGTADAPLRVDALHTPLARVVDQLSLASGAAMGVAARDSNVDVTLFLPHATLGQAVAALESGYGLTVSLQPVGGVNRYQFERSGLQNTIDRVPLAHLQPEAARLLLPDFLLRDLRADPEHNALVVSAPPALRAKIRQDLKVLDQPSAQIRIEADVYEISRDDADQLSLQGTFASGKEAFDTSTESFSTVLQPGQRNACAATLDAIVTRGRGRLISKPSITCVSGAAGTLFAGQTRYLTVLQNNGSGQNIQSLQLPIGTTLTVTPTSSGGDTPITLSLAPSVSTIDSIEKGTGLPTVGTRSLTSVVRLRSDDTLVIGGLTLASDSTTRNRPSSALDRLPLLGPLLRSLFSSHTDGRTQTVVIMLVTARLLSTPPGDHS